MSVRKLLPIVLLLAAVSLRCSGSPAEPEGMVLVTQTTSTSTSTSTSTTSTTTSVIPPLVGGGAGASPLSGLASATVFSFFASPPSGGVPPYLFAWNFGDGGEGAGSAPTHVYPNTGTFTAVATATDSRGMTTQSSTTVSVRTVTGRWTATFPPSSGLMPEPIDLVQNQTAVTVTINDTANLLGFASGTGTVTNPRNLTISAVFRQGTAIAFGVNYNGRLDDTLNSWSGTVTGYAGCPCTFTATRPTTVGDSALPIAR
jgi:hypothetical protein